MNHRICSQLSISCCVCGNTGSMNYDFPDIGLRKAHGIGVLRETLACVNCGATMRDRQMAYGLLTLMAERSGRVEKSLSAHRAADVNELKILDTDAFGAIGRASRGIRGYCVSQFRPDMPNGATLPDGSVNVDLVDMPFEEGTFDVIMTSDVMEHVGEDDRAHREIYRCLAPNGAYIFTVPYDPTLVSNRKLTQPVGKDDMRFFLDWHVHGDPHSSSGIVAHRIYGRQLLDDLRVIGFDAQFVEINMPEYGIFGGDLFVATKRA